MPAGVSDLRNQGGPAALQMRSLTQEGTSIRAMRFGIEDLVDGASVTFDDCESQSLDPQFEAVKFKGLRLSQP